MHHHRPVRRVVRADVFEAEPLRQVIIHLHGPELPFAPDAVADDEVNLRPVEGRLADGLDDVHLEPLHDVPQVLLRLRPVLRRADVLVRLRVAQADAHDDVGQAERRQHQLGQLDARGDFALELVGRAEQVRVVLREAADADHPVEFAGLLEAVHRAELRQPQRQIAVAVRGRLVNLDVVRAVHRLEQVAVHLALLHPVAERRAGTVLFGEQLKRLALDDGRILRVLVIRVMPAGAVEAELADVRGVDVLIAALAQLGADPVLQLAADHRALGHPEHQARADNVADMEQLATACRGRDGRASGLLRAVSGNRRAPAESRTRCRRCAGASRCARRRASTRRPRSAA